MVPVERGANCRAEKSRQRSSEPFARHSLSRGERSSPNANDPAGTRVVTPTTGGTLTSNKYRPLIRGGVVFDAGGKGCELPRIARRDDDRKVVFMYNESIIMLKISRVDI